MIEEETARLVAAGAPPEIAREVVEVWAFANKHELGPLACTQEVDEQGRLLGLGPHSWDFDEGGNVVNLKRWTAAEAQNTVERFSRPNGD